MKVVVGEGNTKVVEDERIKLDGYDEFDLRLVRLADGWRVVEYTTGRSVAGYGTPTKTLAKELALKVLDGVGKLRLQVCVEVAKKENYYEGDL